MEGRKSLAWQAKIEEKTKLRGKNISWIRTN